MGELDRGVVSQVVDWGVVSGGRFVGETERKKVVGRRLDMLERATILPGSPLGAFPERWGSYRPAVRQTL